MADLLNTDNLKRYGTPAAVGGIALSLPFVLAQAIFVTKTEFYDSMGQNASQRAQIQLEMSKVFVTKEENNRQYNLLREDMKEVKTLLINVIADKRKINE